MSNLGNLLLHTSPNAESAAKAAAIQISKYIKKARAENKTILFLTSGGSAFLILEYIKEAALGPDITIGVLDERFDPTNEANQFSRLKDTTFYNTALGKSCKFIDSSVNKWQTLEELAKEFENSLRLWKKGNPDSMIISTIGMGPDGHTSGIMPFPEDPPRFNELFKGKDWVTSYDAEGKNPYPLRVTTTLTFLKTIDHPIVYIIGNDKKTALCRAIQEKPFANIPASFLLTLNGDIYIDEKLSEGIASCSR